jgi:hypothetical protein
MSTITSSSRVPLANIVAKKNAGGNGDFDSMTVEEFLGQQCALMIENLRAHGKDLVGQLRGQLAEETALTKVIMANQFNKEQRRYVNLKVTAGPHLGQKFRLEPMTDSGEDVFKIGRSTGKLFKEKGVSMYKDKEISTTHAKIEIKNGQVFFTDVRSTNGSSINGAEIEAQCPVVISDGDTIGIGGSELIVNLRDLEEVEEVVSL